MLRNFFGIKPEYFYEVERLDKFIKNNINHKYKRAIEQYIASFERNMSNNPADIKTKDILKNFKKFYSKKDLINIFEIIDEKL